MSLEFTKGATYRITHNGTTVTGVYLGEEWASSPVVIESDDGTLLPSPPHLAHVFLTSDDTRALLRADTEADVEAVTPAPPPPTPEVKAHSPLDLTDATPLPPGITLE